MNAAAAVKRDEWPQARINFVCAALDIEYTYRAKTDLKQKVMRLLDHASIGEKRPFVQRYLEIPNARRALAKEVLARNKIDVRALPDPY